MMFIGEISRRTGASPKAIRHYESLGLLGQVTRAGSYRVYTDDEVRQVGLIRQAQALGFRLSELLPALDGRTREPDWQGLARQIDHKRASLRVEIQRLRGLDAQLGEIGAEIRACLDLSGWGDAGGEGSDPPPGAMDCPRA
ncbi:MerR family transcriptional regulator [Cupriavidus sp. SK-3]|uniref:MerR family transcriptional regulator n=1 Tax=Cupriavidus sp. SK-3 TaxID=1470558 RepID=UPI00068A74F7|nr:MerR family transcriptional regulator [Cupriavidus sp. SK-3]